MRDKILGTTSALLLVLTIDGCTLLGKPKYCSQYIRWQIENYKGQYNKLKFKCKFKL